MALLKEYRAFRRTQGDLPHTIELSKETLPSSLNANDVLIKIHAVSLNYRDVAMLDGKYPVEVKAGGIPASDCAATVVSVGDAVKDFKKGDYVSPIFNLTNLTGLEDDVMQALGGDVEGVLRDYAVCLAEVLVHLPKRLSHNEVCHILGRIEKRVDCVMTTLPGFDPHMRRRNSLDSPELAGIHGHNPERFSPRRVFATICNPELHSRR
jgi:D-arabinose 1-dehydrogenase-like Zn-dependent alcohol dehydrogenase